MMMMTTIVIIIVNSTGGEVLSKSKSRGVVESVVELGLSTFPITDFHTQISRFILKHNVWLAGREAKRHITCINLFRLLCEQNVLGVSLSKCHRECSLTEPRDMKAQLSQPTICLLSLELSCLQNLIADLASQEEAAPHREGKLKLSRSVAPNKYWPRTKEQVTVCVNACRVCAEMIW